VLFLFCTRPEYPMTIRVTVILLLLLSFIADRAMSQNKETETHCGLSLSTDVVTRYVWRGYDLNHKDPSVLNYLEYSPKLLADLTLSTGFIMGIGKGSQGGFRDAKTSVDEVDFMASYEKNLMGEAFTGSVSLQFYKYTSGWTRFYYSDREDFEVSVLLTYAPTRLLKPFLFYSRGLDDKIIGNYIESGLSSEIDIRGQHLQLEPKLSAGISNQYEFHKATWSNINFILPLTCEVGDWTIIPSLYFTKPLQKALNGNKKAIIYGDVHLEYDF